MKFIVADSVKGKIFIEATSRTYQAGQEFDLDEAQYKTDTIQMILKNGLIRSLEKLELTKEPAMVEFVSNSKHKLMVGDAIVSPQSNFFLNSVTVSSPGVQNAIKDGYISLVETKKNKKKKEVAVVEIKEEAKVEKTIRRLPTPLQAQKNQILNPNAKEDDDEIIFADKKQEKERLDKFNKRLNNK